MNNYQLKINKLAKIIQEPIINNQVKEINKIIETINQHDVLDRRPVDLGLAPNELDEIQRKNFQSKRVAIEQINNLLNNFRSFLSRYYGIWSLPNLETVHLLKSEFDLKKGLEIMAGNAYWSKALTQANVKMIASDSFTWAQGSKTGQNNFYPTQKLDAISSIEKYDDVDFIMCAWAPNFGDSDCQVLDTYRKCCDLKQTKLFFVGEKNGATNTAQFWQKAHQIKSKKLLKVNQSFKSFDFIDEKIFEIK
ncbi:hypothetical protein [Lactobacillus hominis]|uniref:SAM-dependent methyltransferase n=1 Tax=Lactobacillus hominis DSM 23910 = CRBIP 24.179 TaxID=1423758 RepID=I7LAU1_9LACO|nr:hypothetical protein [Lactobacillus hominis]KRM85047.1 SAM-dependent methyltransferase [Lactobacillus hominis DSM 23910 = CRBIP 24.179]MCT3348446.1 SAM-dependent methyltransferase [Lactobacillus hominis]CCI82569.1 Putative uncharacterized protein [Lactobacillus hominis DSM 23910 = CRBIP 24.179]